MNWEMRAALGQEGSFTSNAFQPSSCLTGAPTHHPKGTTAGARSGRAATKLNQLWGLACITQGRLLHLQEQDPKRLQKAALTTVETNSKILIENEICIC